MAVKRVIALEGDTVYPREPYPHTIARVPVGHVWVEGEDPDPRHNADSHTYGPISMGLITGKITHILWPIERIGRIGRAGRHKRTKVVEASEEEVDALYMEWESAEVPDSYTEDAAKR
ncbi:MAG: hypothetical protein M1835_008088 [Candelina submexicana]|nr:MAG: hypothetical protein M1835_008088 [Candelina submexicana]